MVLWAIATFIGYFMKGMSGFGNTLIITSIMAYVQDNAAITPVELILTYPANIALTIRYRKHADWRVWLPLAVMVVIGGIPGMLLLKNLDTRIIKIVFGFVVIVMGISMLRQRRDTKKLPRIVDFITSLAAGIVCGMFGVGTMVAAYLGRIIPDTQTYKANLSCIFFVENTMRILLYLLMGLISLETLKRCLILAPFMGIGLWLGVKSSTIVKDEIVRKIVIWMLIISGVALMITNIF